MKGKKLKNKKINAVIDPHQIRKKNGERLYQILYTGNPVEVEQYYVEKFR